MDPNQIRLVGTREPGSNPAMQAGWPGVLKVLTSKEMRQSQINWDERYEQSRLRKEGDGGRSS